ncbi:putative disease resistance protein rpp1, partial [Quercus suber]
ELWFENLKHINFSNRKWTFLIVKIWLRFISLLDFFISLKNGTSHTMRNFKFFLAKLMLKSLKYFNLEGRSSLEKFPNIHPIMKCLEVLELSRSGIIGLLSSIGYLIALRTLYRYNCPNLSDLLDIIYKFQLLEEFVFPTTPSIWTRNSPNCSFGYGFSRSEALNLINCENITELEFFLKLEFFPVLKYLYLSQTNIVNILEYISSFTRLVVLEIISCKKLQKIPRLPQSIRRELWFENLKRINFSECDSITNLPNFCAPNLEEVDLSYCKTLVEVHESFGFLDKLQEWRLKHCEKLQILPSKLMLKSLKYFNLEGYSSLGKFPNVHPIMKCLEILELSTLEFFPVLKYLYLSQTNIVNILEHISSFTRLVVLEIISCKKLQKIPRLSQSIRRFYKEINFVIFSNTTLLYFLIQIGEIIGNLPNKECEDARGDILMDIGPSTRFSHQVLSPSFSSYEDDDCEIIVPGIEIPSWFNFNHQSVENSISFWVGWEIPKITLCIAFGPEEAHRSGLFFIRFTFPSMVVKRNTIKCTCCPTKSGITCFPFPSARHGGCSSSVTYDTNALPFQSFFPTSCGLNMYHDISNNEGV